MAVHLHLHMMLTAALLAEPHQPVSIQPYRNTCKRVIFLYDEKLDTEMTKKKLPYAQALNNGTSTNYKVKQ